MINAANKVEDSCGPFQISNISLGRGGVALLTVLSFDCNFNYIRNCPTLT